MYGRVLTHIHVYNALHSRDYLLFILTSLELSFLTNDVISYSNGANPLKGEEEMKMRGSGRGAVVRGKKKV
jgi:hypothetical protein